MSTPGVWNSSGGRKVNIIDMDNDFLKNSLRFCYRKLTENPADNSPAPPVNNTWRSGSSLQYYRDKMVELGEEAQKRNLIPDNITEEQLYTIVAEWETDTVRRREAWARRQVQISQPAPAPPPSPVVQQPPPVTRRSELPKPKKQKPVKVDRNITFDL